MLSADQKIILDLTRAVTMLSGVCAELVAQLPEAAAKAPAQELMETNEFLDLVISRMYEEWNR